MNQWSENLVLSKFLPSKYSQTGVVRFGADFHSCTVIATMICSALLRGAVTLEKDFDDTESLIDSVVEIMKNGNSLYEIVSTINIDLPVDEVIEH